MLSPEEIHRLAAKTKKVMTNDSDKASCHSDYVDSETARDLQEQQGQFVKLTLP